MKLNLQLTIIALSLGLIFNCPVLADEKGSHKGSMMDDNSAAKITEGGAVKVGNKICPLSNEKVGEMGDVVEVEHSGKIYNLCCKMCLKDFKKDPEKYIKLIEEELAGEAPEGGGHDHDEHEHE